MILAEHLKKESIKTNLEGQTKFEVIEELLDILVGQGKIIDRESTLEDLLTREGYLSTGLENGLAIPHAKTDGVTSLQMAFGIKQDGIEFDTLDGKPAKMIFLVLSPRNTSGPHIQALAAISRNMKEKDIRNKALGARNEKELESIFENHFK
jgi:fructose-specific phosphotransferase system IIA component